MFEFVLLNVVGWIYPKARRGRLATNRVLRRVVSSSELPDTVVSLVPGTNRLQASWPLWFGHDDYPTGCVILQVEGISVWGNLVWGINLLIDSPEPSMSFCWRTRPLDDTIIMVASRAEMTTRVRDKVVFCLRPDVQAGHPSLEGLRSLLRAHQCGFAAEL